VTSLVDVNTVVTHMFALDKLVPGRVAKVHTPNRIEVLLDLKFGVFASRHFILDGLAFQKDSSGDLRKAAHKCLITLVGGKRVLILPENTEGTCKYARVYLAERIHGTPVGLLSDVPGMDAPILEVVPFMLSLASSGFDIQRAREAVQGRR
jgi:hypothetical protein